MRSSTSPLPSPMCIVDFGDVWEIRGVFRVSVPIRHTLPVSVAKNLRNEGTLRPVSGSVNAMKAIIEKKKGDSPNSAMVVPEAIPM